MACISGLCFTLCGVQGATNYEAAFRLAFRLADTSYRQRYDSGCQTVYVFLTDGEAVSEED